MDHTIVSFFLTRRQSPDSHSEFSPYTPYRLVILSTVVDSSNNRGNLSKTL